MAVELDRNALVNGFQKLKDFGDYKTKIGTAPAQAFCLAMAEDFLRCGNNKDGYFFAGAGKDVKDKAKLTDKSSIKLKDEAAAKKDVWDRGGMLMAADMMLHAGRVKYITELLGKAKKGDLSKELDKNVEPESGYYKTPATTNADLAKAKQWLKKGVQGNTAEYDKAVDGNVKDAENPLGADEKVLYGIWKKLVTDAPPWRFVNIGGVKYPSSIAGMAILKKVLADFAKETLPSKGDKKWEDWALYLFGATMTAQPFPDGNKRACRALYAIMMASGGVAFRAPNDKLGSKLGEM